MNKTKKWLWGIDNDLATIMDVNKFFGPTNWYEISKSKNVTFKESEIAFPIALESFKKILQEECPFAKGKKVAETHFLSFIEGERRWNFMFMGVIPNSQNKTLDAQLKMLPSTYELPWVYEVTALHYLAFEKSRKHITPDGMYGRILDKLWQPPYEGDNASVSFGSYGFKPRPTKNEEKRSNLGVFASRKITTKK